MLVCFRLLSCAFFAELCVSVHISSRVVSVSSRAIFKPCSPQRALSSAPLLEMSLQQHEPHTRQVPFVFPPLRPHFGESSLPLTEMSATIKVSPIGGVMRLKGFACLLEAGLGNTLGCHMCHPGIKMNGWESQKFFPLFALLYFHTELIHLSQERFYFFALNEYYTKMVPVI